MIKALGDRHNDTQYYVLSHKEVLSRRNLNQLRKTFFAFGAITLLYIVLSYTFQTDFRPYLILLLIPFALLCFLKLTDYLGSRKKAPDLETVRIVFLIFWWIMSSLVILVDFKAHPNETATFTPIMMMATSGIYIDYFIVLVILQSGILIEYAVLSILCGNMLHFSSSLVVCIVAGVVALYGYWVFLSVLTDKSFEERALKEEGSTDLLTGLLNKITFEKEASIYLNEREEKKSAALLIIDFDNFKTVNDKHGHLTGDAILKRFGNILKRNFRECDIIGRVGGDEFMVLMTGEIPDEMITKLCTEVQHELNISKVGDAGGFSCSIGVAKDLAGFDFANLYKLADDALYEAKARGKAQFIKWESKAVEKPKKNIIYIATPNKDAINRIKAAHGEDYVYMESSVASIALNEISLYQAYLESVFFDYKLPDMDTEVLHKYINSRPIFSKIPVHDVEKDI